MSLPEPTPGLVIRYGFLWSHEAASGSRDSSKDRPCAIIVAAKRGPEGQIRVTLAPITHTPPTRKSTCLEMPVKVCRQLGLDGERQWLRFDELNTFEWPGFDLRPLPDKPGTYVYGHLPKALFDEVRQAIVDHVGKGRPKSAVNRDD